MRERGPTKENANIASENDVNNALILRAMAMQTHSLVHNRAQITFNMLEERHRSGDTFASRETPDLSTVTYRVPARLSEGGICMASIQQISCSTYINRPKTYKYFVLTAEAENPSLLAHASPVLAIPDAPFPLVTDKKDILNGPGLAVGTFARAEAIEYPGTQQEWFRGYNLEASLTALDANGPEFSAASLLLDTLSNSHS
jgi:hypothetical protein